VSPLRRGFPSPVSLPSYLSDAPGGCWLTVRVIPRAGRSEVAGERGQALVVRLAAPPVEGAANVALVSFLAAALDVPRRAVVIVSGERSRDKRLRVEGVTAAVAAARLRARPC
jgi:uncharacterized protein (TIGR00251 family)